LNQLTVPLAIAVVPRDVDVIVPMVDPIALLILAARCRAGDQYTDRQHRRE
jgi:hypothetical protein